MTWKTLLERVKAGKTTESDALFLAMLRRALEDLANAYPGGGDYYAPLARVLRMQNMMEADAVEALPTANGLLADLQYKERSE